MSHILIVDDSISIRQVLNLTLKGSGYQVTEAIDGVDALEKLKSIKCDLIITDLNMPNMDGITFIRNVKDAASPHRSIPIIMLTTETEQQKREKGKEAGAKAWVVKPFQPQQLLTAVEKLTI